MSNELEKAETVLDGLDYVEQYEDQEEAAGGIIVGTLLKFTNDAEWLGNGEELPTDLELVAVDMLRVLQYWKDQKPVKEKTRVLAPDERIPNVEAMNTAVDKSEWTNGPDGKPRGPYQLQRVLYLVDPSDMSRFTYPTSTVGGERAIRDLTDRTRLTRKFRGMHVCPAVSLSDTFMPNRYGGRQRPHFIIKRWFDMSGGQSLPEPTASGPKPPLLEGSVKTVPMPSERIVEPPTLKEQMNDDLPFKQGGESEIGREALSPPATMRLNEKGQCPVCKKKPLVYKRKGYKFCIRCSRAFDIATGGQIDNFAWRQGREISYDTALDAG